MAVVVCIRAHRRIKTHASVRVRGMKSFDAMGSFLNRNPNFSQPISSILGSISSSDFKNVLSQPNGYFSVLNGSNI
jgi:hypothetical protein